MKKHEFSSDHDTDPGDYPYAVQRAGKLGMELYDALAKKLAAIGLTQDEVTAWIAINFGAIYAATTEQKSKSKT